MQIDHTKPCKSCGAQIYAILEIIVYKLRGGPVPSSSPVCGAWCSPGAECLALYLWYHKTNKIKYTAHIHTHNTIPFLQSQVIISNIHRDNNFCLTPSRSQKFVVFKQNYMKFNKNFSFALLPPCPSVQPPPCCQVPEQPPGGQRGRAPAPPPGRAQRPRVRVSAGPPHAPNQGGWHVSQRVQCPMSTCPGPAPADHLVLGAGAAARRAGLGGARRGAGGGPARAAQPRAEHREDPRE